jgi:SAM-dependent methyltransferase
VKDVLAALEREAARRVGRLGRLGRELEDLHRGFTSCRGHRPADYLRSANARRAYLASIGLPNAARALHVLSRAGAGLRQGERGLDAGAGPGVTAIALAALSHPDSEIVLVDKSAPALADATSLFAALFPEGPRVTTKSAEMGDGDAALPGGRFQAVLAGHLLNELLPRRGRDPGQALEVALALAGRVAKGGRLAILEPAQRIPSRALGQIREALVGKGFRPEYPCTHAGPCPVLARGARDWCVVDVPWTRPALVAEADRVVGTNRRRLTVSALVVSRGARPPGGRVHEVLSEPMRAGGRFVVYLCGARGRIVARIPRPPSPPLPRGSWVTLQEGAKPTGRDRSGAPRVDLDDLAPAAGD